MKLKGKSNYNIWSICNTSLTWRDGGGCRRELYYHRRNHLRYLTFLSLQDILLIASVLCIIIAAAESDLDLWVIAIQELCAILQEYELIRKQNKR